MADLVNPLNELQPKGKKWEWTQACEHAFKESKQRLLESKVLVHYDVKKLLRLACDVSPYGVGAILSRVMPNGENNTTSKRTAVCTIGKGIISYYIQSHKVSSISVRQKVQLRYG